MEMVLPAVPSPGIMSLIVGLVTGIAVVVTGVVGTRVVSIDVGVIVDVVSGGEVLVHPLISNNPIIRIAGK
jgi:ABC-type amino acid transport system permease subunit